MKTLFQISLITLALLTPAAADDAKHTPCPMMSNKAMQADMQAMMTDMQGMMKTMSDPAMKARMVKMRDHMDEMMKRMGTMPGGMKSPESVPPASPDNHKEHHPET